MWPGFDYQTQRYRWIEFVGSLLYTEMFSSGNSSFPLPSKPKIWVDLLTSVDSVHGYSPFFYQKDIENFNLRSVNFPSSCLLVQVVR